MIVIENLEKKFGKLTALSQINLIINQGGCVSLIGPNASGKTTLIKQITALLGVTDKVTSPTYSLVNEYSTTHHTTVYHFDFYRINAVSEAYDMGFEEYAYSGNVCLIEWPQNIAELLPPHLSISINKTGDTSRTITISEVM